jgi:hypothetical protein
VNPRWAIPVALLLLVAATPTASALQADVPVTGQSAAPPIDPNNGVVNPQTPLNTKRPVQSRTAPNSTGPSQSSPANAGTGARTFTVIGAGDVLLHDGLWHQAARDAAARGVHGYDFGPLLASVKPAISSADLAICHLETPLAPADGPFSNFPLFSVPPQIARALAETGYDSCSTASNHSLDRGQSGVARTLDALDAAGVRHPGMARSPREAATLTLLPVRGVVVGHLSYTFSFNGLRRPSGKEWLANYLEPAAVLAEARRAKAAGAEVVIVSLHWGTEYSHAANGHQTSLARRLLASPDIDLILGHHSHVVQPLERIGDEWVAYGMGNQVAYQHFSGDTRDGIMPRFTFTEVLPGVFRATRAEVLPTHMWLDGRPVRLYDVSAAVADRHVLESVKASCRASMRRTTAIVGDRGAHGDGLIILGG